MLYCWLAVWLLALTLACGDGASADAGIEFDAVVGDVQRDAGGDGAVDGAADNEVSDDIAPDAPQDTTTDAERQDVVEDSAIDAPQDIADTGVEDSAQDVADAAEDKAKDTTPPPDAADTQHEVAEDIQDTQQPGGSNGDPCSDGAECNSNHCVDGVCCESVCSGICMACNVSGKEGSCAAVLQGQDPADECPGDHATCGGVCDGEGHCTYPGTDVSCGTPSCDGASDQIHHGCDGSGDCQTVTTSCIPYKCDASEGTCYESCTADGQCVTEAYCDNGVCRPETVLAIGKPCGHDFVCESEHCVDGVCCDEACAGVCESCALSGQLGTCTTISSGQDPDNECGDAECNGSGACDFSDTENQLCGTCRICQSGTCVDAASGTNPDNTCGEGSCAGECNGSGQCQNFPAGSRCATCKSCHQGYCSVFVAVGDDPFDDCVGDTPSDGCDAACNGVGACTDTDGTVCGDFDGCEVCASQDCVSLDPGARCDECMTCSGAGACEEVADGTDPSGDCPKGTSEDECDSVCMDGGCSDATGQECGDMDGCDVCGDHDCGPAENHAWCAECHWCDGEGNCEEVAWLTDPFDECEEGAVPDACDVTCQNGSCSWIPTLCGGALNTCRICVALDCVNEEDGTGCGMFGFHQECCDGECCSTFDPYCRVAPEPPRCVECLDSGDCQAEQDHPDCWACESNECVVDPDQQCVVDPPIGDPVTTCTRCGDDGACTEDAQDGLCCDAPYHDETQTCYCHWGECMPCLGSYKCSSAGGSKCQCSCNQPNPNECPATDECCCGDVDVQCPAKATHCCEATGGNPICCDYTFKQCGGSCFGANEECCTDPAGAASWACVNANCQLP